MEDVDLMDLKELPLGAKRCVKFGDSELLLIHTENGIAAVEAECPHAGAKLIEGAVCNGRLVCPWHMATFELPTGSLIEPPAMRSLKSYPVLIEGGRILVGLTQAAPGIESAKRAEKSQVLIVGVGAAGAMAVSTLEEHGFAGKLVVVDPNADEPVDRTQLSKDALGAKVPLDKIGLDIGKAYERLQTAVVNFSASDKSAKLSDGRIIRFDKALIATGGKPKRLEIPGAELAYTLRHPEDVRKIIEAAKSVTEVVIIGTSFIALEAASALAQMGLHVTVTGVEIRPFSKIFGEEPAQALMNLHERGGTNFRLGVEILQITHSEVKISKDGEEERLPSQLAIFGVGVDCSLPFTHDLPEAEEGAGITVTSSLKAAKDIWVAGDVANVEGTRIEHWRVAQQHGHISALGIQGEETNWKGVPFFWTYHFGKRLAYLGSSGKWTDTVIDGSLAEMSFLVFYLMIDNSECIVTAVLGCERDTEMAKLAEPMRNRLTLESALLAIR